ncbi:MAG: hypothetical protein HY924_11705 [Elusimicrobia bacterium]|nr:hypothetical protein [Elusimicrobiota bacterium]
MLSSLVLPFAIIGLTSRAHAATFRQISFQARPTISYAAPAALSVSAVPGLTSSWQLSPNPLLPSLPSVSLGVPSLPMPPAALAPVLVLPSAAPAVPDAGAAVVPSSIKEAGQALSAPANSSEAGQDAVLAGLFDGSVPILGGGIDSGAQTFSNAYGLYSWVSGLPEVAASPDPELAAAGIVLALRGLAEQGPFIVMKDPAGLTAISANDPNVPPVQVSLKAKDLAAPASPGAAVLATKLAAAKARDEADPGKFYAAEVLAKLSSIADAKPEPEKPEPGLEPVTDIPLDPLRQPQEYLGRMLRDAARAETPEETLAILKNARSQSKSLLNSTERFRFLEALRSLGELLAGQHLPGLLERVQLKAGDHDRAGVESVLETAMAFVEYAPGWKARVFQAAQAAMNTLAVLDQFGPIDPATGLPFPKEEAQPAETPSES